MNSKCNSHDHHNGECFEVEWKGAVEDRFEKSESLAHMSQDAQQEYIKQVNRENKIKVKERLIKEHQKPF